MEPCWRKSSCPCSEDFDLDGRNKIEKEETQMGVDDGCGLRNIEECSSIDFMGTSSGLCLHTSGDGELTTYPRQPILLLDSSTVRKLLLNVGQNLSYDFSLVLDQSFGPHKNFTLYPMSVPQLSEGNMNSPCGPLGKPNPTSFLLIFSPSIFIESSLCARCSATLLGAGVWWEVRQVRSP